MKLGCFELDVLSDGTFRLDGGSMFGVVPKALWQRTNPPDENNRILMGLNCLLVRTKTENVLIETGIGNRLPSKEQEIFGVKQRKTLMDRLQALGLTPGDIHIVICTHLHFDHVGWNTKTDEHGDLVPTFPRATYVIQRAEWVAALHPNIRTKMNYNREHFLPLEQHGVLRLVEDGEEIAGGISVIRTGGHSDGHQVVKITSEGKTALFLADLVPMVSHIKVPYVMSYDLYPMQTIEAKQRILQQALAEEWLLIFVHSPTVGMGFLREKEGKWSIETVERVQYDA
jgi:glyoxylase-like metal-dependent hydrolase (beta-lactamase superfamily II)